MKGKLVHEVGAGGVHRGSGRASRASTPATALTFATRGLGRLLGAEAPITSKTADGSGQLVAGLLTAPRPEELAEASTWHHASLHHPFLHKQNLIPSFSTSSLSGFT